jgi:hypothetical protein
VKSGSVWKDSPGPPSDGAISAHTLRVTAAQKAHGLCAGAYERLFTRGRLAAVVVEKDDEPPMTPSA